MIKNDHSPTIKSTSANEELEAKQHEIERLRAEGWTQAEIGEAVGASQMTVSRALKQMNKSQISQTDDSTTTQRLKSENAGYRAIC